MSADRTALVERLAELATAIDTRDWDAIAATLTDDCIAYSVKGPAATVRQMQDHLGGVGPTQHLLGNQRIAIDGDVADVRMAARVYHVGAGPFAHTFYECLGDYTDQWVRIDDVWRLRRRHFAIRIEMGDFGVLRPA